LRIDLTEISEDERPVLDRLAQLYTYDFSEHDHGVVGEDGRFSAFDTRRYFVEPHRHAFFVRVDGKLAGFALVHEAKAFRDTSERVWRIGEFLVMRAYRNRGVGERVATRLFERFGGTWEVSEVATNIGAQTFWRKVIGRYTGGDYDEIELDDNRWEGPVQYFHADGRD